MLDLHRQLPKAKTPREQESHRRQIAATDKAIDAPVHELCGLTEEETGIAEGGQSNERDRPSERSAQGARHR